MLISICCVGACCVRGFCINHDDASPQPALFEPAWRTASADAPIKAVPGPVELVASSSSNVSARRPDERRAPRRGGGRGAQPAEGGERFLPAGLLRVLAHADAVDVLWVGEPARRRHAAAAREGCREPRALRETRAVVPVGQSVVEYRSLVTQFGFSPRTHRESSPSHPSIIPIPIPLPSPLSPTGGATPASSRRAPRR